ncbi:MAG: hypothetical protein ACD_73C00673G0008 [uncultured bacterium]|nr:MAG: hypothetical protein ACD_73C00673G0008 [uncultured bacterium]
MKPSEIKEKKSEWAKLEKEWREEIFRLSLKNSTKQLEKTHRIKEVKRDLARLLTLRQQEVRG